MADDFINIKLNTQSVDRYFVRTSIFKALQQSLPHFSGKLLDTGCGKMPYRDYILENSEVTSYTGLDIENALMYDEDIKPDVTWDGSKMPFDDNAYDSAMATEVLEHVPEPARFMKEVHRVLKPGGTFFFTVPFLWPLHEVPHDEYRYTPFALQRIFKEAGFEEIEIKALGGYSGSMAVMTGLWLKRHMKDSWKNRWFQKAMIPVIKWLIKRDRPPKHFDKETMITGLYGVLKK